MKSLKSRDLEHVNSIIETHYLKRLVPSKVLAWSPSPKPAATKLATACIAAARSLVALDDAADELIDPLLPLPPAAETAVALRTEHLTAQLKIVSAMKALTDAKDALAEAQDAFWLPAPAATAEIALDIEMRAWLSSIPFDDAGAVFAKVADHSIHNAPLVAAARFQGPSRLAEFARVMYRQVQEADHPETKQQLIDDADNISWAAHLLAATRQLLDEAIPVIGPSVLVTN